MGYRGFLSNFDITSVFMFLTFSSGEFERKPGNQSQSPYGGCLLCEGLLPRGCLMHKLTNIVFVSAA